MTREVRFTATAAHALGKLPESVRLRVLEAAGTLGHDPLRGKALKGSLSGLRSLRIGAYRIVYSVERSAVLVRAVGHRRDVYR